MTDVFAVALTTRPSPDQSDDPSATRATAVFPSQPTSGVLAPAPAVGSVRDVLAGLDRADFTVLTDFCHSGERFAAADHVVVGQGGVFVLAVAPAGVELVDGGIPQAEGLTSVAADAAAAIAELLPRTDPSVVTPVVCLTTGADVDACVEDVLVCSTGNLGRLLSAWPSVMDAERARFVGRRLSVQQQPVALAPTAPVRRRGRGLRGLFSRS
ncbi:MAG TPA: hypothetical protein VFL69_12095 [Marmoricola sp.]|nr:hypothetical protein [Marmoricola sp.]